MLTCRLAIGKLVAHHVTSLPILDPGLPTLGVIGLVDMEDILTLALKTKGLNPTDHGFFEQISLLPVMEAVNQSSKDGLSVRVDETDTVEHALTLFSPQVSRIVVDTIPPCMLSPKDIIRVGCEKAWSK